MKIVILIDCTFDKSVFTAWHTKANGMELYFYIFYFNVVYSSYSAYLYSPPLPLMEVKISKNTGVPDGG